MQSEAHSATDAGLESNIDLFSYTYPLPRPQGAGEGSANPARAGAAVPMPKQAQSHQGAPREYPEKMAPAGYHGSAAPTGPWRGTIAVLGEQMIW